MVLLFSPLYKNTPPIDNALCLLTLVERRATCCRRFSTFLLSRGRHLFFPPRLSFFLSFFFSHVFLFPPLFSFLLSYPTLAHTYTYTTKIAKGVVKKVKPNVLKVIKTTGSHANRGGRNPDINKELAAKNKKKDEQDGSPSSASKVKPKLKAAAHAASFAAAEGGGIGSSSRRTKNASIHESGIKSEPRRRSFDGKAPMPLTYKTSSSDGTNAGANPEVLAIMMGVENKNSTDSREAEAEAKKKAFFHLPRASDKKTDESTKREEADVNMAQANDKQRRRSTFTHT